MSTHTHLSDLISKHRNIAVALAITVCSPLAVILSSSFDETQRATTAPFKQQALTSDSSAPASAAVVYASQQHSQPAALHSPTSPFAPSLEGTEIDGYLQADENGDLVLSIAVKDLFDYFLNTVGEVSPEDAIGQILLYADLYLPDSAKAQVISLLTDYINYREAALAVMDAPINTESISDSDYAVILGNALNQLKTLRRDYMSPAAVSAFFEMEEAYADYTLGIAQVQLDPTLSAEQKGQQTALLQAQLPPQLALSEQALAENNQQHREIQAVVERATEQGLDEYALRAELERADASPEAIQDILEQKRQQDSFNVAYAEYLRERKILEASGLAEDSLQSALDQLLAQHFATEQMQTWAKLSNLNEGG